MEETESTSPYEFGVGGLEKSLHVERETAEVKHHGGRVARRWGAGNRDLSFCVFPHETD
jgi:hypothetical protein